MSVVHFDTIECSMCGTISRGDFSVDYPMEVNQTFTDCGRCGFKTKHLLHNVRFDKERPHCTIVQNRAHIEQESISKPARICPFCDRPLPPFSFSTGPKPVEVATK